MLARLNSDEAKPFVRVGSYVKGLLIKIFFRKLEEKWEAP